jgi:hypothetical protein
MTAKVKESDRKSTSYLTQAVKELFKGKIEWLCFCRSDPRVWEDDARGKGKIDRPMRSEGKDAYFK